MKLKKILLALVALAIVAGVVVLFVMGGNKNTKTTAQYKVVASNFASYDFLRAIIGENKEVELTFLLGPGKDAHSYDPTAQDLIKIQDANLFVYVGGEMEKWATKVIESQDKSKTDIVCIADYVDKMEEKEVDGAEEHEHDHDHEEGEEQDHDHEDEDHDHEEHEHTEGAFDEHIWTSPANAESYIAKIKDVDKKIKDIVDNKKRDRLIFADKMPMQYFIDYYKLKVSAAFDGCSTEVDPSAKTVAYLQNKVKEEKIPVILYIELNPGTVANTIATETGTKSMRIQTLHNVSLDDFNNGETWVSLMTRNIDVLKAALQ